MVCCMVCWTVLAFPLVYVLHQWVKWRSKHQLEEFRRPGADGVLPKLVGFFHPYCNAGGGGERVLWVAIRALQNMYPNVRCVIYTGDTDATREQILIKAQQRFNITLPRSGPQDLQFVFLYRRRWVEASSYPVFTLLGQSLGSIVLGWEALMKFTPDVYIDTMGYAFTLPLFRYIGGCKVGCYLHYPTVSTDMLQRVSQQSESYNNASFVSRSPTLSYAKIIYYKIFAYLYGLVGRRSDTIMVNSSWTEGHILELWNESAKTRVVYPPCNTEDFLLLPLKGDTEPVGHSIVSIAQFRPEKDHTLQIESFNEFLSTSSEDRSKYKLVLIGSCRNDEDSARVEKLRLLAEKLGISDQVEFRLNVSFTELKEALQEATIGIHTMWNEHFGIGVVEIMAAGTIILAHNSGGPKLDIVVDYEGSRTGYLADTIATYAAAMETIFTLSPSERREMAGNARKSVLRFSDQNFESGFLEAVQCLMGSSETKQSCCSR